MHSVLYSHCQTTKSATCFNVSFTSPQLQLCFNKPAAAATLANRSIQHTRQPARSTLHIPSPCPRCRDAGQAAACSPNATPRSKRRPADDTRAPPRCGTPGPPSCAPPRGIRCRRDVPAPPPRRGEADGPPPGLRWAAGSARWGPGRGRWTGGHFERTGLRGRVRLCSNLGPREVEGLEVMRLYKDQEIILQCRHLIQKKIFTFFLADKVAYMYNCTSVNMQGSSTRLNIKCQIVEQVAVLCCIRST